MDESQLRKKVLAGRKTERVVFAASKEMKASLEKIAEEKCMSLSADDLACNGGDFGEQGAVRGGEALVPTGKKLMGNTIAREQWLLRECRIVAAMRLNGMSDVEAAAAVKRENLFQYPTERTLTRISKACNKRIDAVRSREIVEIVAEGLPDAAAQANLYMMMCAIPG